MLLHVGYHKTGSSFLQRDVFPDARLGFCDPVARDRLRELFLCANPFDVAAQDIQVELTPLLERAREKGLVPVLSLENLSGDPRGGGFGLRRRMYGLGPREICDLLHSSFPQAKVLIVVREQRAVIASLYKFLVNGWHGKLSATIDEFLDQSMLHAAQYAPLLNLRHFEYHWLVEHYQKSFGAQNVLVMPYELLVRDPLRFLNDILGLCGLPAAASVPAKRRNPSPSALACRISLPLRRIVCSPNRPGQYSRAEQRVSDFSVWAAKRLPRSLHERAERHLEERIARAVRGRYAESNARLQAATGLDLGSMAYELP